MSFKSHKKHLMVRMFGVGRRQLRELGIRLVSLTLAPLSVFTSKDWKGVLHGKTSKPVKEFFDRHK